MTYETVTMTKAQCNAFLKWFDEHIGTDREENENGPNEYYVVCFDLELSELHAVREKKRGYILEC